MTKLLLPLFFVIANLLHSQTAVTFPDEFSLADYPQFDNWTYQQETFFVLPLSLNEFIAIESIDFNISYNPQIVQPMTEFIGMTNSPDLTEQLSAPNTLSGFGGTISTQSFEVSSELAMLTIGHTNSSSPITQEQYDSNGEILMYIPFKKINACDKSPFSINFWDGSNGESFVNPSQTNSIIINQNLSEASGNIYTQDAVVSFNILSASVEQIGNAFHPTISGGTPPYSFEWTDKMDVVLSTDSIFPPSSATDYLFYVYDANQCESILFLTFEEAASICNTHELKNVYPNPAVSDIKLIVQEPLSYTLFDYSGRSLRSGQITPFSNTLKRGELPSGSYILILHSETKKTPHIIRFL
ncbi:MAG: T9SS type A sorting domain-containing protein [Bacteroidota bacterium]|nr:T9SS type A sorting domain-containing protein [Bacteroidota bacterium]